MTSHLPFRYSRYSPSNPCPLVPLPPLFFVIRLSYLLWNRLVLQYLRTSSTQLLVIHEKRLSRVRTWLTAKFLRKRKTILGTVSFLCTFLNRENCSAIISILTHSYLFERQNDSRLGFEKAAFIGSLCVRDFESGSQQGKLTCLWHDMLRQTETENFICRAKAWTRNLRDLKSLRPTMFQLT